MDETMEFQKFEDFVNTKLTEDIGPTRQSVDYTRNLNSLNGRFPEPKQAEEAVKRAGYAGVGAFIADRDPRKWAKLQNPGQGNYLKPNPALQTPDDVVE